MSQNDFWWKRAMANDFRYTLLLAFLLAYIFLGSTPDQRSDVIMSLFFTAVLIMGAYSAMGDRRFLALCLLILLPTLATTWLSVYFGQMSLLVIALVLSCVFLLFICVSILKSVMKEERVTIDKISAALCSYILLGLTWAILFALLDLIQPGSFLVNDEKDMILAEPPYLRSAPFPQALYFSFTTLTTLGYGDITPVTPAAQRLVVMEALVGQIFLVVLVARLVGMEILHSSRKDKGRIGSSES